MVSGVRVLGLLALDSSWFKSSNIGASIIRIEFWGPLYYIYNKEPQNNMGNYLGPYIRHAKADTTGVMANRAEQAMLRHGQNSAHIGGRAHYRSLFASAVVVTSLELKCRSFSA